MNIKVCGMRENISQVAALRPDLMGFIFWEPSSRYLTLNKLPELPAGIKKVGVFVDMDFEGILEHAQRYGLDLIQLHGQEPPELCVRLQEQLQDVAIIKAFAIDEAFDFHRLQAYSDCCDYFLFDTKGKLPGGNSRQFNWELLSAYESRKPYFISGGIGPDDSDALLEFLDRPEARHCVAVDVNSRFETVPGHKDIDLLKDFMTRVRMHASNEKQ